MPSNHDCLSLIGPIVDRMSGELIELSHSIHDHPELGLEEYKAAEWLTSFISRHGFTIQRPYMGLETAFRAVCGTVGKGPQIAFLAEYDALKGLGHACGHNIIAASSAGAAAALAEALQGREGAVYLYGTPAEETFGSKVLMSDRGAFDGIDCAMMMHPSAELNIVGRGGLAAVSLDVVFEGKPAHSSKPDDGINALTSAIGLFNAVNAQLHLWPNKSKINGIITEGGQASNVIPDRACCSFTMRAERKDQIVPMIEDFKRLVQASALLTGAKSSVTVGSVMAERHCNRVLDAAFKNAVEALGEPVVWADPNGMFGSSDIGNVSLLVPAIHTYLSLEIPGCVGHTPKFCQAARSERGDRIAVLGAKALAMTGWQVATDGVTLQAARREYEEQVLPHRC
ncbi:MULTISPECIES: M20 family metallopeptidase [Jonquetella]|uniref:M20 family metallopeptidase n=1 Tax=Jonquetella TaxID=428711 RepID=UPI0003ADAC08|nr:MULTISPECIES: M20 family metallopeptidase [Jonquetella]ERL24760.1 amidohydrolase [Jonquetella sp. BV3C21]